MLLRRDHAQDGPVFVCGLPRSGTTALYAALHQHPELHNNRVFSKEFRFFEKLLLHRRGSPENALTPEEIEHKFMHVVAPCVDKARAERIVEVVRKLETLDSTRELISLVGRQ